MVRPVWLALAAGKLFLREKVTMNILVAIGVAHVGHMFSTRRSTSAVKLPNKVAMLFVFDMFVVIGCT